MADAIGSGLGPADWSQQLEDLALVASASPAPQQQTCMEDLLHLLAMAPARTRLFGYVPPDSKRLLALFAAQAWESASLSFLPATAGHMTSHDGSSNHVVSIVLPGAAAESTSSGATLALAVVSAFALAIVDLGIDASDGRRPDTLRGAANIELGLSPRPH